jgi:hypothetical protein
MAVVHDRMPVILRREDWTTWLSGAPADAFALCRIWEGQLEVDHSNDRWVDGSPNPTFEEEIAALPLFGEKFPKPLKRAISSRLTKFPSRGT